MLQTKIAYLLLAGYFLLEFVLRKDKTAKSIGKTEDDNKSTRLIGLTFFIVLFLSFILNFLNIGQFQNLLIANIGLAMMVTGLLLRIWSMKTLSKYYTRTLLVVDQQKIIRDSPYKIIRHPGYLSSILIWTGAGLGMQNIIIFFIASLLMCIAYYHRIINEEKMLKDQFGSQYQDYQKQSWRLIPFVW